MNKGLVTVLVLVIIAGAGLFFWSQIESGQQERPETTQQETLTTEDEAGSAVDDESEEVQASHTVTYSDGNFSPAELNVSLGETVEFSNQTTGAFWVASDTHPSHTDYPEFDSGSIEPGGTYSFTFERAGTWGYHDHLNPQATGTISVE